MSFGDAALAFGIWAIQMGAVAVALIIAKKRQV